METVNLTQNSVIQNNSHNNMNYVKAAGAGAVIGIAATGVDLFLSSKGKSNNVTSMILDGLGSGHSWAKGDIIESKALMNFAKNKWGALVLGAAGGAVELVFVTGIINFFKGKSKKN